MANSNRRPYKHAQSVRGHSAAEVLLQAFYTNRTFISSAANVRTCDAKRSDISVLPRLPAAAQTSLSLQTD